MITPYLLKRRAQKQGNASLSSGKKIPGRLPTKSAKMKIDDPQYKKLVKEMLELDDRCELKVPGVCTQKAEGLHHQKRRGILLLVKKYLKRSCNACNNWAERNPIQAIKMEISMSVHKKEVSP